MPGAELAPVFVRSGKVRDLYDLDAERLLLVASDRISAFDVVLPTEIPDKGKVLTGLSRYWFRETEDAGIVENHLLGTDPSTLPEPFASAADELRGRSMICRRARVLPVEVIVRGYLAGSGWKEYQRSATVCGIPLSAGLRESDRLPEPLFTPSTKAEIGHDENIDFDRVVELIGGELAERVRAIALALYRFGAQRTERAGIILADTKFELGLVGDGDGAGARQDRLLLVDEVLTPDSSRFWDAADYEPGRAQASYDKQYVRDWLEAQEWDKTAPGPELPTEVVAGTRSRYVEAFERITGGSFERYRNEDVVA
jgi:phosphoribosylaminoimidazole-succinocarboxamide synthase